jgi:putative membrane protein
VVTTLPPDSRISRSALTEEKKQLIRLIVAFAIAVKHHLRAEGGVHHDDLRGVCGLDSLMIGLLPPRLASMQLLKQASLEQIPSDEESSLGFQRTFGRPHTLKRRPTGVRVLTETTPLIKPGVLPDVRSDAKTRAEKGLGKMVELGLPLIM